MDRAEQESRGTISTQQTRAASVSTMVDVEATTITLRLVKSVCKPAEHVSITHFSLTLGCMAKNISDLVCYYVVLSIHGQK